MRDFDHNSTRVVDQPDATCMMIRAELLKRVGGFDARYSILYNDVDLCYRIKKTGQKIYFIPDAEVIHHGSQSTRKAPALLRLEMYRDILNYYDRYSGPVARWFLLPILFIRLLLATQSPVAFRLLVSRST